MQVAESFDSTHDIFPNSTSLTKAGPSQSRLIYGGVELVFQMAQLVADVAVSGVRGCVTGQVHQVERVHAILCTFGDAGGPATCETASNTRAPASSSR
jgi:hypothetical protein